MASAALVKTNTPGVYRRGGRYVAVYRDASGKQRKLFAGTIKEAKRLRSERQASATPWSSDSRERIANYAPRWIEAYQGRTSRGIRESTRDDYRDMVTREIVPYLGRLRLSEVGPPTVKDFAVKLAGRGLEPSSVRKVLAVLKAMYATALEDGLIRSNPTAGVRIVAPQAERVDVLEDDEQVKALSADELDRFLVALTSDWATFFTFLAESGLRIGEAIELRWADVDLEARTLRVRRSFSRGRVSPPKSKYGRRTIRLSAEMADELRSKHDDRLSDDALVFTGPRGGRIDAHNLRARVVKPTAVRIGLGEWIKTPKGRRASSWVGLHSFRHTCATRLFGAGWNVVQVSRWLGHSRPSFTLDVYVSFLPGDLPAEPPAITARGQHWATGAVETGRDPAFERLARKVL